MWMLWSTSVTGMPPVRGRWVGGMGMGMAMGPMDVDVEKRQGEEICVGEGGICGMLMLSSSLDWLWL